MGMRAVCVVVAVLAIASGASADQGTGGWSLHLSGTMFSGTFTNPTASVVNGVAVGTQLKTQNPIVDMTFQGRTCGLYAGYGSAYCYTSVSVGPGKSAAFSGHAKSPIGKGGLQMCSSADRGMDNTCVDVAAAGGSVVQTRKQSAAVEAIDFVNSAVKWEKQASVDSAAGSAAKVNADINVAENVLTSALARSNLLGADGARARIQLRKAIDEDREILHESGAHKPGWQDFVRGMLMRASSNKENALANLRALTR